MENLVEQKQAVVINAFEKSIGKSIPLVDKIDKSKMGVTIADNNILGLSLTFTSLSKITENICDLCNLEVLVLGYNKLKELPE